MDITNIQDNSSMNGSTENGTTVDKFEEGWSYEMRFEFVVHGLLICSVGLLGLLGNLASIVTLSRPQMKNSINTILIGLVSCDSLLIVTSLLMFSFTVFRHTGWALFIGYFQVIYPYAVPFVYPVALIAQTGSAYLTLAVTIERYVAVCWPLRARSLCTIGRAKTAVCVMVSFAVIYNIPRFFEITWAQTFDKNLGENRTGYFPTELRMNMTYISIYVTWMYLVFMYIIPFATLAVFNMLTWLEMRKAIARRAELSMQEQKEHNLATMLLVVVLVFFICNLLPLVVNILELVGVSNHRFELIIQVSNFLVTINSSVNILIYCTFGKKFRTVFMQIFFGRQPPCIVSSSRLVHYHHHNHSEAMAMTTLRSNSPSSSIPRKYSYNLDGADNKSSYSLVVENFPSSPSKREKTSKPQTELTSADSILKAPDHEGVAAPCSNGGLKKQIRLLHVSNKWQKS